MKKSIVLAFCLLSFLIGAAQTTPQPKSVTISGKVQFLNTEKLSHLNKVWIFTRDNNEVNYIDSTNVNSDGTWKYTFKPGTPKLYLLDIAKNDFKTIWTDADLFIATVGRDTAKIKVKNPRYIATEGSDDNNFINLIDHVVYLNNQNVIADSKEQYQAGLSKDTAWIGYLKRNDPVMRNYADQDARVKVLVNAYKDKPVVLYGLKYIGFEKNKELIKSILDNLALKNSWFTDGKKYMKEAEERNIQIHRLDPGKPMPVVAYNNADGKPVSIASYKGKYLLVDFWASWCGPCRKAIPRLKTIYEKYNAKGFEILGISIDKDEKAWRKALTEEAMPWKQVLSPDMNVTMKTYNFYGIPTLFFVDKEGNIIAKTSGFSPEFEEKILKVLESGK